MQVAVAAGLCLLFWGLATFVMKLAGSRLDPVTTVVCNAIGYLLIGAVLLPKASLALTPGHFMGVGISLLFMLGNLFFYKLAQTEQLTTIAPITALYVTIPILLGFLVLREPITLRKCLGIALALVAIYLLSSSSEA